MEDDEELGVASCADVLRKKCLLKENAPLTVLLVVVFNCEDEVRAVFVADGETCKSNRLPTLLSRCRGDSRTSVSAADIPFSVDRLLWGILSNQTIFRQKDLNEPHHWRIESLDGMNWYRKGRWLLPFANETCCWFLKFC